MQSAIIKGINPEQTIFLLPTHTLDTSTTALPAFIGHSMANSMNLSKGDYLTIRWRDAQGTFDATEIVIAEVFTSNVPAVETGQVYVPLDKLWEMTGLQGEATLLTYRNPDTQRAEAQRPCYYQYNLIDGGALCTIPKC